MEANTTSERNRGLLASYLHYLLSLVLVFPPLSSKDRVIAKNTKKCAEEHEEHKTLIKRAIVLIPKTECHYCIF
jgi:hypothetical protein